MNEYEMKAQAIQEYINLQRIKAAQNRDAEIEYQENALKIRLQALGIPTDTLDLK